MEAMTDPLDWADGILDRKILEQIGEIRSWKPHEHALVLIRSRAARFVAALIGLACGRKVYRIWPGETPSRKGAILFAETDRQIEDYPGLVLVAANPDAAAARRFKSVITFKVPASWRGHRARRSAPKARPPRSSRGRSRFR
jgi:hypothetical protein